MHARSLLVPFLIAAGCTDLDDERHRSAGCPEGEVCSADTPHGLIFAGASFGGAVRPAISWQLPFTAVGGTQTVRVDDPVVDGPIQIAYAADVVGDAAVTEQDGPQVTVLARRAGALQLRIVSPRDGTLYDRAQLDALPIDRIELRPGTLAEFNELGLGKALWRGARTGLAVRLLGGSDAWLVDESMTVTAPGGAQVGWDLLQLDAAGTSVTLDVVTGSQQSASFTLPVVDAVAISPNLTPDATATPDVIGRVCFVGLAGGAQVLGAPWSFALTGPAVRTTSATGTGTGLRNCVYFQPTGVGTVTITAQVGLVSHTISLVVQ